MKHLIAILLLCFVSVISNAQEQPAIIFKWEMSVHHVPIDGVSMQYDTLVIWGVKADTIAFNFSGSRLVFFEPSKMVWYSHDTEFRAEVEKHIEILRSLDHSDPDSEFKILLKQDRFNELYIIRIVYTKTGVSIFAFNCVFGTPSFVLRYISPCKICIDQ